MLKKMISWWQSLSWGKVVFGAGLGAAAGLMYYYLIGCRTGTCPITADPTLSSLYGALVGTVFNLPSRKESSR